MSRVKINHIDADSLAYAASAAADRINFVAVHEDLTLTPSPFKTYTASKNWCKREYQTSSFVMIRKTDPLKFVCGALKKKIAIIQKDNPNHSCIFYLSGKSNFRDTLSDLTMPYKGNRHDTVPPKHLTSARQYLIDNYETVVCEGYEADDAVIMNHRPGDIISGIDKDLYQHAADFYNYNIRKHHTVTPIDAATNFWAQVWLGDASDNVPGLSHWCKKARIGPKRLAKLMAEWPTYHYLDFLRDLYRSCVTEEEDSYFLKRVTEQCKLLWLLRSEGGIGEHPYLIQATYSDQILTSIMVEH